MAVVNIISVLEMLELEVLEVAVMEVIQLILFQQVQLIQAAEAVVGQITLLLSKTLEAVVELVAIDVLFQEKTLAVVHQPNPHLLL